MVPLASKSINWKGSVKRSDVYLVEVDKKNRCKGYIDIDKLITGKYRAKHYIMKNRKICKNDLYEVKNSKITFNFGLLEIQRDGQIVNETNSYIKIRNKDGKIEKIYKNGNNL